MFERVASLEIGEADSLFVDVMIIDYIVKYYNGTINLLYHQIFPIITMIVIECGFPGYLVNGYVLGASYLYGDIVRYTCRSGYRLYDGDATQRCARNRLWSGRRPTCKGKFIRIV